MARAPLKVFVSSTSKDLSGYRAVATDVILDMRWTPVGMEHFGAQPWPTVEACQKELQECDLVLLLVAFQRGTVPTKEQGGDGTSSYTALELKFARERRIPVLAMRASEMWPQNLCEEDAEAREWVKQFRSMLGPAPAFEYEDPIKDESRRLPGFRTKLREVLVDHRDRLPAATPDQAGEQELFEGARSVVDCGDCIPFIGPGVYDGALSQAALVRELWPGAPAEQACTATAAQYAADRTMPTRPAFLTRFERILVEQTRRAVRPATYDLAASLRLRRPPLLVSVAYDLLLEERLKEAGRCVIVSHVLRSKDCENDGKLVVLAPDSEPALCLADKLEVGNADFVVYKPLGSPLLHARLDPALEIDTVVVTETDHLTFLGRLENQHTKVPSAFHRPFQTRAVLFLGLPLDVWQYRLVLQVFKAAELGRKARSLTVREPSSEMEKVAWESLPASALRMDPNAFAARVLSSLAPVPGAAPP